MILLSIFAFLGGVVTILSPCILPILPIVLSGSVTGGKQRPWGVITGFIASFTFFTLFLSAIVKTTNISADSLRTVSVVIIAGFGLSLLVPAFQMMIEKIFSKLKQKLDSRLRGNDNVSTRSDFVSGLLVGLSLGLLWTPCVGPILASIITLAATKSVTSDAVLITIAYSIGTSLPLLAITYGGRQLLQKTPWLVVNSAKLQKAFGVFMIVSATAIYLQVDRKFQTYILEKFPSYGVGLTKIEDNPAVKEALQQLTNPQRKESRMFNKLISSDLGSAPEFILGGQWFNSTPLTIKGLRGKVVLVDIWTYTCINCIRTLPYLKSWHTKYKDKGLVIVGVHTPEFEFEKNPDNVARAIKDFGITYPVMQDNEYATWNAYNNRYWPAKYLIDKNGRIRYTHFGEGNYDETETKIQELLKEAGSLTQDTPVANPTYQVYSRTPELYLGFNRLENLYTNEQPKLNQVTNYSLKGMSPPLNQFGFIGDWNIKEDWAEPSNSSSLQLQFDAREVFLVMRPSKGKTFSKVIIRLDGQTVSVDVDNAGEDVIQNNQISVTEDRLYKLIKLPSPGKHHLYLEFPDGNIELYAFTFG